MDFFYELGDDNILSDFATPSSYCIIPNPKDVHILSSHKKRMFLFGAPDKPDSLNFHLLFFPWLPFLWQETPFSAIASPSMALGVTVVDTKKKNSLLHWLNLLFYTFCYYLFLLFLYFLKENLLKCKVVDTKQKYKNWKDTKTFVKEIWK
jgi:hypothetical protein